MAAENRSDVHRLVRRTLDAPADARNDVGDLLAGLEHEDRLVRLGAAWAICAVAAEHPQLAARLADRLDGRRSSAADLAGTWIEREVVGDGVGRDAVSTAGEPAATHAAEPVPEADAAEPPSDPDAAEPAPEADAAEPARGNDSTDSSSERETDTERTTRDEPPHASKDTVVDDGRFAVELERTAFDSLQIVDRVASDRHAWTYAGLASIDARQRAVLVRSYRPPRGARFGSFAEPFEAALEQWAGVGDHDGVLTVYDYGRRPRPWAVLEYVPRTLRDTGRLPAESALRVGHDAASALAHAHERGVTHQSLDPRSLAIDTSGDRPTGRVLNVSVVDAFRSADGPLPMDSRFAAPELFDEQYGAIDRLTDVYQLGAVCYTAVTGRPPYEHSLVERGGPAGLDLEPPSTHVDVPSAVDRVLATATATHKIARYESATEFAAALRGAIEEVSDQ